ncbi:MAG: hypothetical protein CL467_09110 [Acidimicrobiaceae bacterium]|nr:hypothetical protein [Acidimicrobiaceae bacterium]
MTLKNPQPTVPYSLLFSLIILLLTAACTGGDQKGGASVTTDSMRSNPPVAASSPGTADAQAVRTPETTSSITGTTARSNRPATSTTSLANDSISGTALTSESADQTAEATTKQETGTISGLPDGQVIDGSYSDPRGELFSEFQDSFDRGRRFTGLDTFCRPPVQDPLTAPVNVEPGISADSITVVHLATRLEELSRIGFKLPLGDIDAMLSAFIDLVNGRCGGIHGRWLDLRTVEVSALGGRGFDIDTLREAACLEAIEIHQPAVVLAVTPIPGTASSCLTMRHRTAHLTTGGVSDSDLVLSGGRLQSLEVGDRSGLRFAVLTALDQGLLDEASIGIVVPDAPQRSDDLLASIAGALDGTGHEFQQYQVGCEGTTTCQVGLKAAVSSMVVDEVNVVIPLLNMTSLPWLVLEMLDQEMPQPLFIQSGLNGHGLDAIAARIAEFGGIPAGDYYDGTIVVDTSATGSHRIDGAERRPFDLMCARTWAELSDTPIPLVETTADDVHRSVLETCSLVRWIARAVDEAGPDPSLLGLQVSLANVGPLDVPDMRPTTVDDRHLRTLQVRRYEHPCRHGTGFGKSDGCLVPVGPPVILDRSGLPVTGLEPPRLPPNEVRVFVANGSGLSGVAGLATNLLRSADYDMASPGNASAVQESFAYYRPGHLGDARAVREVVSPYIRIEPMPASTEYVPQRSVARVRSADVVLVVGLDLARRISRSD